MNEYLSINQLKHSYNKSDTMYNFLQIFSSFGLYIIFIVLFVIFMFYKQTNKKTSKITGG